MLSSTVRWPGLCAICRRWASGRLCEACLQRFAAPMPRCLQCALRLSREVERCNLCIARRAPPVRHTLAAVDYGFPWDGLITGFKFHHRLDLANAFAQLLHGAVRHGPVQQPSLVLPIPLSAERLRERGYNQAWELARRVARWSGIESHPGTLLRIKNTAHQLGLDEADRQRNLKGAFLVEPRLVHRLRGRTIALVDDVMTSGATADEAARTLRAAGAAEVQLWVLARTPPPDA